MKTHSLIGSLVGVFAVLMLTACSSAAALEIGQKAPDIAGVVGPDGKVYSLSDFADAKVIVIAFTCNGCPVAVAYEDRFNEFAKNYSGKGVQLIAINTSAGESIEAAAKRAEEKGFVFPYLRDDSQEVTRAYGATCTPHLFILDQGRNVAYMGSFDDSQKNPKEYYVVDAVESLLAGQTPEKQITKQFGCSIKFGKK
jgi:peroxiredoxin